MKLDASNLVVKQVDSIVGKSNWLVRASAPTLEKIVYDSKFPPLAAYVAVLLAKSPFSSKFQAGNKTEATFSNGQVSL